MSMRALLQAVLARLRAAPLSYASAECEIGWDGQPPPYSGQVWVAVYPAAVSNQQDQCLDEYYGVDLTLTMRASQLPVDRWGQQCLILATSGLYARAEAIRAVFHMDETSRANANAGQSYSIGAADNGFVQPLVFKGMDRPVERGPDWWWANPEESSLAPVGLSIDIHLADARRVQIIEEQS